jgi:hypothetical protein
MTPPEAPAIGEGVSGPSAGRRPSLRFRYSKLGKIRFTSQRDVARMWERAFRRVRLPVAWSGGFSPRPLLSFGLALPTGAESLGEYLDVRLDLGDGLGALADLGVAGAVGGHLGGAPGEILVGSPAGLSDLVDRLSEMLPDGITVQAAAFIADDGTSLQQEVSSCTWDLEVFGLTADELATRVEQLLDAPSVVVRRVRKGRSVEDDLRPAVRTLSLVPDEALLPDEGGLGGGPWRLRAELATQPRGVRPGELLEGLGAGLVLARARRRHQWIERDGARWEPLGAGLPEPAPAPHAAGRAS